MQKIVINACHGGFSVSGDAVRKMREWGDEEARAATLLGEPYSDGSGICDFDYGRDFTRNNPNLVKIVEEMGEAANGFISNLKVIEVPDGIEWTVEEYDGWEWIAEKHRTWG